MVHSNVLNEQRGSSLTATLHRRPTLFMSWLLISLCLVDCSLMNKPLRTYPIQYPLTPLQLQIGCHSQAIEYISGYIRAPAFFISANLIPFLVRDCSIVSKWFGRHPFFSVLNVRFYKANLWLLHKAMCKRLCPLGPIAWLLISITVH